MDNYWEMFDEEMKKIYKKYKPEINILADKINDFLELETNINYIESKKYISKAKKEQLNRLIKSIDKEQYKKYISIGIKRLINRVNISKKEYIEATTYIMILKLTADLANANVESLIKITYENTKEYSQKKEETAKEINKELTTPLMIAGVLFYEYIAYVSSVTTRQMQITVNKKLQYDRPIYKKHIVEVIIKHFSYLIRPPKQKYWLGSMIDINNEIMSRVQIKQYVKGGITKVKQISVLDEKTSKICRGRNGNIIDTAIAIVGVNIPPLHPHCRSYVVPYYKTKGE